MRWQVAHFCTACKQHLSDYSIFYSEGICPRCGNVSDGTICDDFKRARRWIRTNSKWQFWKNVGHWEYKDEINEQS